MTEYLLSVLAHVNKWENRNDNKQSMTLAAFINISSNTAMFSKKLKVKYNYCEIRRVET